MKLLKLIRVMATLAMLGAAGSASAGGYGYSYNNIFGLTITNPTGVVTIAGTTNISRSTATLNGVSVINGGTGVIDSPQAAVGAVTKGENDFTQQGPSGSYSRGDGQIVSTQFPPIPPGATSTQAVNVAEVHLDTNGTGDASGRNGSTTGFSVNFVIASPTASLLFNFSADPFMQVFLQSNVAAGSSSTANLVVTFTITDGTTGATVFNWAPDGLLNSGISGGTEFADAANLNTGLATNTLTKGTPFTYDPTGCGAPGGTGIGTGCGGTFSALTNELAAGNYTLTLNAVESVDVIKVVPEPGTLALLGLGLAGLCFGSRRKETV